MLDKLAKQHLRPYLTSWSGRLLQAGLTANRLTLLSFAFGLALCFSVGMQLYWLGFLFLLLNRFFDGMAGIIANESGITALGSYLDWFFDFTIYGLFVFFFILGAPEASMAGTFLVLSYLAMIAAYTGHIIFSTRTNYLSMPRGGMVEHTEMFIFMAVCCVIPSVFAPVAVLFGFLCWATAITRTVKAIREFSQV